VVPDAGRGMYPSRCGFGRGLNAPYPDVVNDVLPVNSIQYLQKNALPGIFAFFLQVLKRNAYIVLFVKIWHKLAY
jgi:hypothetical protein